MKKITLATIMAFILIYASSCKDNKEVDPVPTPLVYDDYAQLKIGNYWVYQIFDVDSLGEGPALNEFDSIYVSKDTMMEGNTYYFITSGYPTSSIINNVWLRDSLHYIIDSYGKIYFSSEDFSTIFISRPYFVASDTNDTLAWLTEKMADGHMTFSTPAGIFLTNNFQTIYDMYPNHNHYGSHKVLHRRYAKDIGIVSETLPFYVQQLRYRERRLLRYHLN